MYVKCSLLTEARHVSDKLPFRDVVTWNVLIAGYIESGLGAEALSCYRRMHLDGVSPVACTLTCGLKACGIVGVLEFGQELHAEMLKRGYEEDLILENALLEMYNKCGAVTGGEEVYSILSGGTFSWNSMIKRYGENHEGYMAVKLAKAMLEQGVQLDAITFTSLLVACSHASMLQEGHAYFKMMEEHGVGPNSNHYTCMVDLLARSGCIHEAQKFIEGMQCPPTREMLTVLLSACKNYDNLDVAKTCFQQLIYMDPEEAATYMLMGQIYASMGMWEDVKQIEEMRMLAGAKKKQASTFLELNQTWYSFSVSDNKNKYTIQALENVNMRLKDEGYVPILNLVLRDVLAWHEND